MTLVSSIHSSFAALGGRRAAAPPTTGMSVGRLESLPKWLNLVPMVLQWTWLSLLYRSATLPSCANPTITSGGLVGEGKLEYFRAMGPVARAATAPHTSVVNAGVTSTDNALAAMRAAGLEFPIVMKPDLGWCGFGVRIVRDETELTTYLASYPLRETIVLQRFVPYEGEAGVYYMRAPGVATGQIIGILLRTFPRVVGDGIHTVADLIAADPRLARLGRDGLSEPCCDINTIPERYEVVRLSTIGSTRVGGLYQDGSALVTAQMTEAIDKISHDIAGFHIGRYDLRYESLQALQAGRDFSIVEVNGAGAEAVHAWDPRHSLLDAYRIVFQKQRRIFAMGDAMRKLGHRPIGVPALARLHLRQQCLIRQYPRSN